MPLTTIWTLGEGGDWMRKLVDAATFVQLAAEIAEQMPARPPGTDYAKLAAEIPERARQMDEQEQEGKNWAAWMNHRLWEDKVRGRQAQYDWCQFIADRLSDHEYIEGMFELYSQCRYRLIQ